jgi:hypothetical protein
MSSKVKTLLQQINFIEADMELHKQILVTIPSDNKQEIEKIINKISRQKKEINDLKLMIKKTSPDEYKKIVALEKATEAFKNLSKDKQFISVDTLNETGECFITLNNGIKIDCLVKAKENNGNWTILTIDGETKEYPGGFIQEN